MNDSTPVSDPLAASTAKWTAALPEEAHLWDPDVGIWTIKEMGGWSVGVMPLMFTGAVIVGRPDQFGYDDRWCFHSVEAAFDAARRWLGPYPGSEPEGWHRHPATGRRREDGEPATEHVAL